jgi:ankyrin repeat protein
MAYAMREAVGDSSGSQVMALLEAGFPPNHPVGCGTYDALDAAVARQNPVAVGVLLKYGAHPKPSTFVDAAFLSSEGASLSILKQFVAAGVDVNSVRVYPPKPSMTWTALDQAVWRQHAAVVEWLLAQHGIAVNVVNGDRQTPLMIARQKGDPGIIAMLVAAGARE